MNVKLKVLTAAILAGFVGSASAGTETLMSSMDSFLGKGTQAAGLTKPERGAYAGLEALMQIAEARIYEFGCANASNNNAGSPTPFDVTVAIDDTGKGSVDVLSPGGDLLLNVTPLVNAANTAFLGDGYKVTETGGVFKGKKYAVYSATAAFDAAGGAMILDSSFSRTGPNLNSDPFIGRVIKDFYWVTDLKSWNSVSAEQKCAESSCSDPRVPFVRDWGLQALAKKGYPQVKYWQWSKSIRSDGITGHTHLFKERIYNANRDSGRCRIEIHTSGFNDADGFNQAGEMFIYPRSRKD